MSLIINPYTFAAVEPFDPLSIAGLSFWVDADDAGTIVQSGGTISWWADKSGNSKNATQTTPAYRPSYAASKIGGKPSVYFPVPYVNDHWFDVPGLNAGSNITCFFVVNPEYAETGLFNTCGFGFPSTLPNRLVMTGGWWKWHSALFPSGTDPLWNPGFPGAADSVASFWTYLNQAAGLRQIRNYVNGVPGLLTGRGGHPAFSVPGIDWANPTIGTYGGVGGGTYKGWLGEILIYNNILSDIDRQSVENYLMSKWGIA